jgi:hypothetical protein
MGYGFFYSELSPVNGSFATVAGGIASTDLTPAPRCQDHTPSPSASGAFVKGAIRVHRSPSRVDDVGQRPSFGSGWQIIQLISFRKNRNNFARGAGHVGQIGCSANCGRPVRRSPLRRRFSDPARRNAPTLFVGRTDLPIFGILAMLDK